MNNFALIQPQIYTSYRYLLNDKGYLVLIFLSKFTTRNRILNFGRSKTLIFEICYYSVVEKAYLNIKLNVLNLFCSLEYMQRVN